VIACPKGYTEVRSMLRSGVPWYTSSIHSTTCLRRYVYMGIHVLMYMCTYVVPYCCRYLCRGTHSYTERVYHPVIACDST